ncbi:hypothetical protein [Exilibacterium tricleocarpae]|nr:hypothetical protein [Exilibacterium tricleocarpae]
MGRTIAGIMSVSGAENTAPIGVFEVVYADNAFNQLATPTNSTGRNTNPALTLGKGYNVTEGRYTTDTYLDTSDLTEVFTPYPENQAYTAKLPVLPGALAII